jgi:uncharacterized membrane protein YedE/YeeE
MKLPRYLISLVCGLLFGAGLALAGMTRPQKVLGFLDVAGHWDPSLIFVLGGAVAIATVAFHFILQRRSPLLAPSFDLPTSKSIDSKLVVGALIFGVGWGLSGYCPRSGGRTARSARRRNPVFPAAFAGGLVVIWALEWTRDAQQRARPAPIVPLTFICT